MTTRTIPMFKTGRALQSLRHAGYDLPAALGEVIDNSFEANANLVRVRMDEETKKKKKHIHRIVIVDDGDGMDEAILHNYLQVGFSTRYMSTNTIGKFGVGAKLAAFNFSRRVDAYSRSTARGPWQHVFFDLDQALEQESNEEEVTIQAPTVDEVPSDLAELLPTGTGTMIVWSRIDRLEEGRHAVDADALRQDVAKELSRIFRYFLHDGRKVFVNTTELLPHDPLYMMSNTFADKVLSELPEYKEKGQQHFGAEIILEKERIEFGEGSALLTVTLYPREVVRKRYKGGDELAKKLRVPENMGSLTFVRLNREVSYTTVPRILPDGIQHMDRYIGIEVSFTPEMDEYFGIRNVKRGVEPHGELRKEIREYLEKFIPQARKKIEDIWGENARVEMEHKGPLATIEEAVKDANRTMPQSRVVVPEGEDEQKERKEKLDTLAEDAVGKDEEKKKKYLHRVKDLPFVIENVNFPGTNFIDIQHLGPQTIIRLNTRHRFYREMWEPISELAGTNPSEITGESAGRSARRALEALSLLIIAYAKAETMNPDPEAQYGDLRGFWGQFLDSLLFKVKDII